MNLAMSRSDSEKRTLVCPMVGFVGRHCVSVSKLPVDFSVKIGEGLPHVCIKITYTGLVWSCAWLRGVIYKIMCEQFFEDVESPFALNFLDAAAHNRFRFIRDGFSAHKISLDVACRTMMILHRSQLLHRSSGFDQKELEYRARNRRN